MFKVYAQIEEKKYILSFIKKLKKKKYFLLGFYFRPIWSCGINFDILIHVANK